MDTFDMKLPSVHRYSGEVNEFLGQETRKLGQCEIDEAIPRAFGVVMYVNSLNPNERVGVLDRLLRYLHELKKKLDQVGKEWGVESYSLGVNLTGLELTLDFRVPD